MTARSGISGLVQKQIAAEVGAISLVIAGVIDRLTVPIKPLRKVTVRLMVRDKSEEVIEALVVGQRGIDALHREGGFPDQCGVVSASLSRRATVMSSGSLRNAMLPGPFGRWLPRCHTCPVCCPVSIVAREGAQTAAPE